MSDMTESRATAHTGTADGDFRTRMSAIEAHLRHNSMENSICGVRSTSHSSTSKSKGDVVGRVLALENQLGAFRGHLLTSHPKCDDLRTGTNDGIAREALNAADASWRASLHHLARDVSDLRETHRVAQSHHSELKAQSLSHEVRLSAVERQLNDAALISTRVEKDEGSQRESEPRFSLFVRDA